jgi:hypothetical protein
MFKHAKIWNGILKSSFMEFIHLVPTNCKNSLRITRYAVNCLHPDVRYYKVSID